MEHGHSSIPPLGTPDFSPGGLHYRRHSSFHKQRAWLQKFMAVAKQSKLPSVFWIFFINSFFEYFQVSLIPRDLAFFSISESRIRPSLRLFFDDYIVLAYPGINQETYLLTFFSRINRDMVNLHGSYGLVEIRSVAFKFKRITHANSSF